MVSGGSNNKKHILSPIQLKLARFILSITNKSGLDVTNYYHSFGENKLNKPLIDFSKKELKNKILNYSSLYKQNIIEDYNNKKTLKSFPSPVIQKREYHSLTKKSDNKIIFNYLDNIKNIISNNNNSIELKQSLIENSWLNIIEDKLNDEEFIIQRHKNKLNHVIFEAYKTLLILKEKKVINRKFPLLNGLDKIEYI